MNRTPQGHDVHDGNNVQTRNAVLLYFREAQKQYFKCLFQYYFIFMYLPILTIRLCVYYLYHTRMINH